MLARIVLLSSLIYASGGCVWNSPKLQRQPDGRLIPVEWSKAVEPLGQTRATRPLRYDVLYVADPQTLDGGERGQWYRFWPNGRAMLKIAFGSELANACEAPTATNGDNFSPSISMFYSVVDDRITLEWIALRDEAIAGPSNRYVHETGRVNDDGSFTLTMSASAGDIWGWGTKHPEQIIFRPIRVEPMQRQADW